MRAAGVREIRNRFSEYLRIVAEGETVLVTDRGRVVAQLAPPPVTGAPALSEDEALARLAAAGKVRLPQRRVPSPGAGPVPGVPKRIDLAGILEDVRSDSESR
jgi:prevent-host-death family protein